MSKLISKFKRVLGETQVFDATQLSQRYTHIWKMEDGLQALCLVLPESTEEVSAILKICHQHKQAINIHGGLTNLVGATETRPNEVVISLERMNTIEEIDEFVKDIQVEVWA